MNPIVVLLVEDNRDDVFLFRHAMKKAGCDWALSAVGDGVEAMAYFNGEGKFADRRTCPLPDVVLLDLNMPRMNGFEVLRELQANRPAKHAMIFVLSASTLPSDLRRAYELGAHAYISKPNRVDELVSFLSEAKNWLGCIRLPSGVPTVANAPAPVSR